MQDHTVPYSSWQARENIFAQESFYLQGILDDINEQNTSFLNCKHKHMMKSGAPPHKFVVLYRIVIIEFHGFTSRINSKGYHSLVPGLISILVETVWVPLTRYSQPYIFSTLSEIRNVLGTRSDSYEN